MRVGKQLLRTTERGAVRPPECMRSTVALLISACLHAPGFAQESTAAPKLGPRSFFPKGYTTARFVNVAEFLESPLGDALDRSIAGATLRRNFRRQVGLRWDSLTSWTSGGRWIGASKDARYVQVQVLEGEKVALPDERNGKKDVPSRIQSKVGSHAVCIESGTEQGDESMFARPRPDCVILGPSHHVAAILRGNRRGGVPASTLLPLIPRTRPLGYLAIQLPAPDSDLYRKELDGFLHLTSELDPLREFVLVATLAPKSNAITLRVTCRFKTGEEGPEKMEEQLRKQLQQAFGGFPFAKHYLDKIRYRRQKKDLGISLVLQPHDVLPVLGPRGMFTMAFAPDRWVAPAGREMGPAQRAGAIAATLRAAAFAHKRRERKRQREEAAKRSGAGKNKIR